MSVNPYEKQLFRGRRRVVISGYRFYSPELGRWVSRDPLGERGGVNLYGFAGNDPLAKFDPYGLSAWDDVKDFSKGAGRYLYSSANQTANLINQGLLFPLADLLAVPEKVIYCFFGITEEDLLAAAAQFPGGWDNAVVGIITKGGMTGKYLRIISGSGPRNVKVDFYVNPKGDVIPSTGYRAIGGQSNVEEALTGSISSRNPTYITFDVINEKSPAEIQDLLQLPRRPSHVAEFDTLQLVDDVTIPTGKWNSTDIPEPITKTFPEWGQGGGTQAIVDIPIKVDKVKSLK